MPASPPPRPSLPAARAGGWILPALFWTGLIVLGTAAASWWLGSPRGSKAFEVIDGDVLELRLGRGGHYEVGGAVAATVWNHATATGPLTTFWRAAKDLDPGVADEAALPGAGEGDLGALARAAGLRDVVEGTLMVSVAYSGFDQWWEPYTLGVGPAGDHVAGLPPEEREALRAHCAELLPEGPFSVDATAWVITATA